MWIMVGVVAWYVCFFHVCGTRVVDCPTCTSPTIYVLNHSAPRFPDRLIDNKMIISVAHTLHKKTGRKCAVLLGKPYFRLAVLFETWSRVFAPYMIFVRGNERVSQLKDHLLHGNNVLMFGVAAEDMHFGGTGLYHLSSTSQKAIILLYAEQAATLLRRNVRYMKKVDAKVCDNDERFVRQINDIYNTFDKTRNYTMNFKKKY